MRKSCTLLALSLLTSPLWGEPAQTPKPLVVHEWGTFTVLSGSDGAPLFAITVPAPLALGVAAIATVCGVLAAVIPARRAAALDPAQAIRM